MFLISKQKSNQLCSELLIFNMFLNRLQLFK